MSDDSRSEQEKTLTTTVKDVYAEGLMVGMELGRALATGGRVRDPQDSGDGVEGLHTGDDPIVDACTGVISSLEGIIEDLSPPRDSDVSNALELAHGALEEMRVIDAWAVAKAREAGSGDAESPSQTGKSKSSDVVIP